MKYIGTFLGGIFALWIVAVLAKRLIVEPPPFGEGTPEVKEEVKRPLGQRTAPRPSEEPRLPARTEFKWVVNQQRNTTPSVSSVQEREIAMLKANLIGLAKMELLRLHVWDVELKNQIRLVKKDIESGKSDKFYAAKIREYRDWILRWEGLKHHYTVERLSRQEAEWRKRQIELPRRLDDVLKHLEDMEAFNNEVIENVQAHINNLRR